MSRRPSSLIETRSRDELLPPVDWQGAGVADLKPEVLAESETTQEPYDPLPSADIAVLTWTSAEWEALKYVFSYEAYADEDYSNKVWQLYARDFYAVYQDLWSHTLITSATALAQAASGDYADAPTGPPSLTDQAWGYRCLVRVGDQRVLLLKSSMHLNTDGASLPLRRFVEQILEDSGCRLILSIGTAGGTRREDFLGDVNIANMAHFRLSAPFANASFNEQTFKSEWSLNDRYLATAASLASEVPGLAAYGPTAGYDFAQSIDPTVRDPKINNLFDQLPVLTTNGFVTGYVNVGSDTDKYLGDEFCVVEEDDAVIVMVASEKGVDCALVRNLSDAAVNLQLQGQLQSTWPSTIYSYKGFDTSVNGALAAWAVVAGS